MINLLMVAATVLVSFGSGFVWGRVTHRPEIVTTLSNDGEWSCTIGRSTVTGNRWIVDSNTEDPT